ncbi:MAG: sodium:calcium antiporter [Thermoanaerobacteraceae bacterium]|nr:sodium:calcium antiporter [Thermoanaerobacteraceae bacterium]
MTTALTLIISFVFIMAGAELFTNGVEWVGKRFGLPEGAVGSLLAAVATALPETMVPIIAIIFGGGAHGEEIGTGAILGAPFMLGTLAFCVTGLAVVVFSRSGRRAPRVEINRKVMLRDLSFFLKVYALAILAAFIRSHLLKVVVALGLFTMYGIYAYKTITDEDEEDEEEELHPLFLAKKSANPPTGLILLQVALAMGAIIYGAHMFVGGLEVVAEHLGISAFVLSVIITPVATELPEKFNSITWIRQGKDTLALGNITGAMVFQSSVIPAIGILLTPWELTGAALVNGIMALIMPGIVYCLVRFKGRLHPRVLVSSGLVYAVFVVMVLSGFKV